MKERDLTIERLNKQLEEAKRTASQGSQQTQGEVQELDMENALKRYTTNRIITEKEADLIRTYVQALIQNSSE
jgi:hypothetical protein